MKLGKVKMWHAKRILGIEAIIKTKAYNIIESNGDKDALERHRG